MDEDEKRLRRELTAAYRLSAYYDWMDMVFNHISVRLPDADGEPSAYLVNPEGLLSEEITPGRLLKVDLDGNVLDQPDESFIPAGFVIHGAIHTARENAVCIMHNHSLAGQVISASQEGILPLTQITMEFHNRLAYHDFGGIELEMDGQHKIVSDLGNHNSMIMRNHGLLTVGSSVAEAFYYMYYLHHACEVQIQTLSMTSTPLLPTDAIAERTAGQYDQFHESDVRNIWKAMLRKLDREMPGWDHGAS